MTEYIVHIFDVEDNGCVKGKTEQITVIYAKTDEEAKEIAEKLRQDRNEKEPLPIHKDWGEVEYLCNVFKDDVQIW